MDMIHLYKSPTTLEQESKTNHYVYRPSDQHS